LTTELFEEEHHLASRSPVEDSGLLQELNLAVVIPTLNEAKSVGRVLDEVSEVFKGENFTVVVVDGRSTDGTDKIARRKGAEVIYQRNNGYGDALKTGFHYARKRLHANVVVMMDADLTYDAKDIPRLVAPILKDEADMIVGNRFAGMQKGAMPFINRIGNKLLSRFARGTLRLKVHDTQCGLRAFRSELVDCLNLKAEGMPLAIEMLSEAKFAHARISQVPITYRRRVGVTKLSPLRDGLRIVGTIIRLMRDTEPLLFFGAMAFVLALAGLWFGVDVTLEWLNTGSIVRVPTVMLSVLLLMGAMQFFTIGLVADMIKGLRRSKNHL